MIIVTGATGQLGHTDLEALGVRVRQGDFDSPETLRHSFEGVTQLLIVSSNAAAYGGDPLAQHRSAIDAAQASGARRIVYTSHMGVSSSSAFPPMRDHAATEDMLRQCGLAWTALRNGFYAASGIMLMGDALKSHLIEAPADGKVSWTAHADLAECAAIILAREGMYEGPTPPLTGAQALDLADLASIASELLGIPVRRQLLTDEELRTKMVARGLPERVVTITLGLYSASRNSEFARLDPTLEQLLGRPTLSMRDLIAQKVAGQ